MRYLGLDVHGAATVYCLLGAGAAIVERGSVTTTFTALTELARRLSRDEELTAGQEVGTMCHFVHDIFTSVGVRILSFNAQQLRLIAASRKKRSQNWPYWYGRASPPRAIAGSRYSTHSNCSVTPAPRISRPTHSKSIATRGGGSLRPMPLKRRASTSLSVIDSTSAQVRPATRARFW